MMDIKAKKTFRVLVAGSNCHMQIDGASRKLGFYTVRYVKANTTDEAGHFAVAIVRDDLRNRQLENEVDDPPQIAADEIEEVLFAERDLGFSYFDDDDDDDDVDDRQ